MKHFLLLCFFLYNISQVQAQELFVFTEPASNMAAKSLGFRVMNIMMNEENGSGTNYHLMPELMWGINKKWMLHAQSFFSNRNSRFVYEGGSLYTKYRFLSNDRVHSHFRMAAYARASMNNSHIHQEEIETMGQNSGYELGIIATQLLHKVAISSSVSYERALDNGKINKFPSTHSNSAVNYTFSIGKLMLPKEYKNYDQTNMNLMLEFIGQRLNTNGKSFLDIAPSVQFIIKSQARIDLGYRYQLYSNMVRTASSAWVVRFEYNLFNLYK